MQDFLKEIETTHVRLLKVLNDDPGDTVRIDFSREKLIFIVKCLSKYCEVIARYREVKYKVANQAATFLLDSQRRPYMVSATVGQDAQGDYVVNLLVNNLEEALLEFPSDNHTESLVFGIPVVVSQA